MLNVVCTDGRMVNVSRIYGSLIQCWYSKYAVYGGQNLRDLVLNVVVEDFIVEKIQASKLPYSLVREIVTRKMYWFRNFNQCICL